MVHPAQEAEVIEFRRDPCPAELKWFGVGVFAMGLVAGGTIWLRASLSTGMLTEPSLMSRAIWTAATVFAALYYVFAGLRLHFYRGYMAVIYPVSLIVSHTILGVVFFAMITPIGLLLRGIGHDPLARRSEHGIPTYWLAHRTVDSLLRYFRQF